MKKEFILCAAIYINDGKVHEQQPINIEKGFVISGRRHNNCFQTITDLKEYYNVYIKSLNLSEEDYKNMYGFITSFDRYDNNQIISKHIRDVEILISEDLY